MCMMVTATLPADADVARLKTLISDSFAFEPVVNASLAPVLQPGEREFVLRKHHCHCGTSLGEHRRRERLQTHHDESALKKYRKQGWSEAKIARALEQSRNAVHRGPDEDELRKWERMIRAALEMQQVPYVGLLMHQYRTNEEHEELSLKRVETVPLVKLGPDVLLSLEEDVLYRFTRA